MPPPSVRDTSVRKERADRIRAGGALYLPTMSAWGYIVFLVQVVVAMEVIVLLPFTKFTHSVYRPLALLIHELSRDTHS
jgi:hypothetical protein